MAPDKKHRKYENALWSSVHALEHALQEPDARQAPTSWHDSGRLTPAKDLNQGMFGFEDISHALC